MESTKNNNDSQKIYTIHLHCTKCDFEDMVRSYKAKEWKCPNCEMKEYNKNGID